MERGTVVFFDTRKDKLFGFLTSKTGTRVFFHFNNGETFVEGSEQPKFSGKNYVVVGDKTSYIRYPIPGDELVFNRDAVKSGITPAASKWGFADNFDYVRQLLDKRPVYRVIDTRKQKSIWKGQSLERLRKEFPKFTQNLSKASIKKTFRWQRKENKSTEEWEDCPNPLL